MPASRKRGWIFWLIVVFLASLVLACAIAISPLVLVGGITIAALVAYKPAGVGGRIQAWSIWGRVPGLKEKMPPRSFAKRVLLYAVPIPGLLTAALIAGAVGSLSPTHTTSLTASQPSPSPELSPSPEPPPSPMPSPSRVLSTSPIPQVAAYPPTNLADLRSLAAMGQPRTILSTQTGGLNSCQGLNVKVLEPAGTPDKQIAADLAKIAFDQGLVSGQWCNGGNVYGYPTQADANSGTGTQNGIVNVERGPDRQPAPGKEQVLFAIDATSGTKWQVTFPAQ